MGEMAKAAKKEETFTAVGCDYSAASRQPNATWMAVARYEAGKLSFERLENIGSDKLLVNLGALKTRDETSTRCKPLVIGLDFPFSLPLIFAQALLATGSDQSPRPCHWQTLAELVSQIDYSAFEELAVATSRGNGGEPRRLTDKLTDPKAQSPLHRINPGMLKMTWQGMPQLLELSKQGFNILPFNNISAGAAKESDPSTSKSASSASESTPSAKESASSASEIVPSVMEVYPAALLKAMGLPHRKYKGQDESARALRRTIIELQSVNKISKTPVELELPPSLRAAAEACDDALDAVIAALGAALARLNRQTYAPPAGPSLAQVAVEGWIYVPYPQQLRL